MPCTGLVSLVTVFSDGVENQFNSILSENVCALVKAMAVQFEVLRILLLVELYALKFITVIISEYTADLKLNCIFCFQFASLLDSQMLQFSKNYSMTFAKHTDNKRATIYDFGRNTNQMTIKIRMNCKQPLVYSRIDCRFYALLNY